MVAKPVQSTKAKPIHAGKITPVAKEPTKSNIEVREEKKNSFTESFARALQAEKEQKEHQEYLDTQHRQEQTIRTNNFILQERRKVMEHDGMISVEALSMIASLLQTNPEVKDLMLILSQLQSDKRTQIVSALKTLISAMQ
jgi:hypothetical protein